MLMQWTWPNSHITLLSLPRNHIGVEGVMAHLHNGPIRDFSISVMKEGLHTLAATGCDVNQTDVGVRALTANTSITKLHIDGEWDSQASILRGLPSLVDYLVWSQCNTLDIKTLGEYQRLTRLRSLQWGTS